MSVKLCSRLLLMGWVLFVSSAQAFELVQLDSETTVTPRVKMSAQSYVDIVSHDDIEKIVAPENVIAYIPYGRGVGLLTFRVLSPRKTKMYLDWDHADSLYSRFGKEVKFRRSGDYKSVSFNAVRPVSGYVYLRNAKGKLLRKVHYTIKRQRQFRQSLRAYVRDSDSVYSDNQSMTLSYSLNQRVRIGEPRWSAGISVSGNSNSSKSVSASFGYSW